MFKLFDISYKLGQEMQPKHLEIRVNHEPNATKANRVESCGFHKSNDGREPKEFDTKNRNVLKDRESFNKIRVSKGSKQFLNNPFTKFGTKKSSNIAGNISSNFKKDHSLVTNVKNYTIPIIDETFQENENRGFSSKLKEEETPAEGLTRAGTYKIFLESLPTIKNGPKRAKKQASTLLKYLGMRDMGQFPEKSEDIIGGKAEGRYKRF